MCVLFSSRCVQNSSHRMRWCPISMLPLLRCVRIWSCTRRGRSRLPLSIREILAYMRVLVKSLYFNSLTDSDVVFDSVFEPAFWTVEFVTRRFGKVCMCLGELTYLFVPYWNPYLPLESVFWQVFICLVVILTSSIIAIAYFVLLPLVLNVYSPAWMAWHLCYGNWIIVMIAFHYYKAAKTSPGYLPSVGKITLCTTATTFQIISAWMKCFWKQ